MSEPGEYNEMARQIENYYGSTDDDANWIVCPACNGSGENHPNNTNVCPQCGGRGEIKEENIENFL
jgi:DnaJ-class molecular chaperone